MKTINTITIISLMLTLLSFSSCKEIDNSTGDTGFFLTAKVDGIEVSTDSPYVLKEAFVIRTSAPNFNFVFTLAENISLGTFTVGTEQLEPSLSYINDTKSYTAVGFSGGNGSVTITAIDVTSVEGAFSFTGTRSDGSTPKQITDGKFRAKR